MNNPEANVQMVQKANRARERALAILDKHTEKTLDPAVAKGMDDYIEMVKKRSLDEYYAAEWES